MSEKQYYGQGIEPRLRDHYVSRYGLAYWRENRSKILRDVLTKTHQLRPRSAKYTSEERRSMRRHPWEYPRWVLEEAQIPSAFWWRYFDPEALNGIWQFVQWLLGVGS